MQDMGIFIYLLDIKMEWLSCFTITIESNQEYKTELNYLIKKKFKLPDDRDMYDNLQEFKGFFIDISTENIDDGHVEIQLTMIKPTSYPFDYKDLLENILINIPDGEIFKLHITWDIEWTDETGAADANCAAYAQSRRRLGVPIPHDYLKIFTTNNFLFWDFHKIFVKPNVLSSFLLEKRKALEKIWQDQEPDCNLHTELASQIILALSEHTCHKIFVSPSDFVHCKLYLEAYNNHKKQEHEKLVEYFEGRISIRPTSCVFSDY